MNTNFFGPMSLTHLVLPAMRRRKSGTIVQFSSAAGIEAKPTRSMYSTSKFALEAASEALSAEVKPLNVHVLIVSPALFQSKFEESITQPEKRMDEEYEGSVVGEMMDMARRVREMTGPDDVERGVKAIFDVVMK